MKRKLSLKRPYWTIWAAAILAGTFLSGCRNPAAPVYCDFVNFKMDSVGDAQSVVSADLKYYNPNNFKLFLRQGEADVYINQQLAGHSFLDSTIVIPRKDTFYLPVKMRINMQVIASNALSILLNNQVDLKLEGKARLGKSGLTRTIPIFYEGKHSIPFLR